MKVDQKEGITMVCSCQDRILYLGSNSHTDGFSVVIIHAKQHGSCFRRKTFELF